MRVFSGPSIHSLDQARPPIQPIQPSTIYRFTYSPVCPSVHPSLESLFLSRPSTDRPTDRQQWPVVWAGRGAHAVDTSRYRMQQGILECRTVCSSQSTVVRIRASLWSLRVPMIYCNQESCWPEPTIQPGSGPGTGGGLGRPMLTPVLLTRATAARPPEGKKNRSEGEGERG